jgi:acyl-CoA synthetase (AMP-forming)/AMP-acid ligase II/thioesterase domain-containing protein/acyl carrier protein
LNASATKLIDLLKLDGEAIALTDSMGGTCTREQLQTTLDHATPALHDIFRKAPGPIATLLPDHASTLPFIAAAADTGPVLALNPGSTLAELEDILNEVPVSTLALPPETQLQDDFLDTFQLGVVTVIPTTESHFADFNLDHRPAASPGTDATPVLDEPGLILTTSGSTGRPKIAPLSVHALEHSAKNIVETLSLGAEDAVVHMLPTFHIGAVLDLFIVPLMSGGRVHLAHPISTENLISAIQSSRPSWFQAVPTMLATLVNAHDNEELQDLGKSLRFIRSVSADLPKVLQTQIEETMNVPIIQMYGMTETAGQISSNGLKPSKRRRTSVGCPPMGTVSIMDEFGGLVAPGATGEICVRAANVFGGYFNYDNENAFFGSWFRTGDLGYLDGDGFLFLSGRVKDVINKGGEKIAALEIERRLLEHSGILEAAVFPLAHKTLGEDVGAAVTARPGHTIDTREITEFLKQRLTSHKIPRHLSLIDTFPKLASGKVDKRTLRRQVENTTKIEPGRAAQTETGALIAKIWANVLNTAEPTEHDDFFDAGGDSLAAHTFILALEDRLNITLPANILFEAPTFGALEIQIQSLVRARGVAETIDSDPLTRSVRAAISSWPGTRANDASLISGLRTTSEKPPIFFCANGIEDYCHLAKAIGPEHPFYAMRTLVALPEKSDANLRRLAGLYASEIILLQPSGDIVLGGHCEGASVARMIAEKLFRLGRYVSLMIVIDRVFRDPCPAPALIIWTEDTDYSHHSGTALFVEPERGIETLFPLGAEVHRFKYAHLELMRSSAVRDMARLIRAKIEKTETMGTAEMATLQSAVAALKKRREAYRADIQIKGPWLFKANEYTNVTVTITNTSPVVWRPTSESHLILLAKWERGTGKLYLDTAVTRHSKRRSHRVKASQ